MFEMTYPWWELILRAFGIYIGIFFIFRIIGKKQLGEMSPFDFVLLLIISESISGGLIGEEKSLPGGLISATTLIGISYIVDVLAFKSKYFENIIEGSPQVLIKNGEVIERVRRRELITHDEIKEALRHEGLEDIKKVKFAMVETNGRINIIKKDI